jgi:putative 4-mercaptohistidine N1-methyltranferase
MPVLPLPPSVLAYAPELGATVARAYAAYAGAAAPAAKAAARALHLGCGVGAVTFELARHFSSALGVDARESAIRHARILQHHGQMEFERVREGVLTTTTLARVGCDAAARACASFAVGDAAALPDDVARAAPFDVLLLDGVLARMRQPLDLIKRLDALVAPGGVLVIVSSNDWLPDVTPRNSWLGGFKMNGEACSTLHMLKYALKKHFTLVETKDVPRATNAHDRRVVIDIMEVSSWQRK